MTNLSPTALAVWTQYCGIVEEHGPARLGLAAALRAAADQGRLGPDHWEGSQSDERELGWNAAMEWVKKIAAELETPTTENR